MMVETVTLKPKAYNYLINDSYENQKAKDIKKCAINEKLKFKDYKNCLLANRLENEINHLEKK